MYSQSIINLISETHHSCKKGDYTFMILREYLVIFLVGGTLKFDKSKKGLNFTRIDSKTYVLHYLRNDCYKDSICNDPKIMLGSHVKRPK